MFAKLQAIADKVEGYVDKAQEKAAGLIVETLHPKVHSVIDTRVDVFRDSTLEALPRQCEDGLKARTESSSVAWIMDKVLGDRTDELVEKLIEKFRPGITDATDGLSSNATDTIMDKFKQWIDGQKGSDAAEGADTAEADTEGAAAQMEQLQVTEEAGVVPEETSRGLDLSAAADQAPEGYEEATAASTTSSSRGVKTAAFSTVSSMAGAMFGVESSLPKFESSAKDLVHPLFEKLKTEVWELVPATLQEVLGDLVKDSDGDGIPDMFDGDDAAEEGSSRMSSWMSKVSSKLQGKAGGVVNKVVALTLDAIDDPMRELINKLVDDLEHSSTAAAFKEIRRKLAEYKLISNTEVETEAAA